MLILFQTCFFTGVLFAVVSFLLGQLFDVGDADGSIDFEASADLPGLTISPLKPIVIVAFVTVFGGAGLMSLHSGSSPLMALVTALGAALIVAVVMYYFVVVPLHKAQNTSAGSQQDMIGKTAITSLRILGDSFGRISYSANGNSYNAPARSVDGKDIERGAEVIVEKLERNVFYVRKAKKR